MTNTIPSVSPKWSLIGYKLKTWFNKNKESIKNTITITSALVVSTYPESVWIKILFAAGTGLISNWFLNFIDFWFTEVQLKTEKKD